MYNDVSQRGGIDNTPPYVSPFGDEAEVRFPKCTDDRISVLQKERSSPNQMSNHHNPSVEECPGCNKLDYKVIGQTIFQCS